MSNDLSVWGVGTPSVAFGGAGAESVTVNYKGSTDATLRLYAVPASGGNPILVGEESFVVNSGNSGQGTATVTFDPNAINSLPNGNYTFYVVADNTSPSHPDITGPSTRLVYICFMQGTRISTPSGEVAVEDLRPGDLVLTADGRSEPVLFVGRQLVMPMFGLPEARNPIRIRAGALADNVPARDLRVSAHHGIVVDGVLCFAGALVNGLSILQETPELAAFTYYNIETERHEVLLAEGAPVESFCDNVPRERFDNFAEFQALFPEGREVGEMDLPHAKSRRQVPAAILARLEARAVALFGGAEREAA